MLDKKNRHLNGKKSQAFQTIIISTWSSCMYTVCVHMLSTKCTIFQSTSTLLAWTSLALQSLLSCFPPASNCERPHHLAQRWQHCTLSLHAQFGSKMTTLHSFSPCPSLLHTLFERRAHRDLRAKREHWWHCIRFQEAAGLPRVPRTGLGKSADSDSADTMSVGSALSISVWSLLPNYWYNGESDER